MLLRWVDSRDRNSIASKLRRRRMRWFDGLLTSFTAPVRILDVGGTALFWKANLDMLSKPCEITLLNLTEGGTDGLDNVVSVAGDARKMTMFADKSFDVVFSNSVIEHVGTLYDQISMAQEVERIAKAYFVQTPNRYFPIEPHFLFPCWQFLPVWIRARMLQTFNLGWMLRQPDFLQAKADVEQIRLLDNREMRAMFRGCIVQREKIGPFTKSLIAMRK